MPSVTPSCNQPDSGLAASGSNFSFPKQNRLLRSSDFRRVYDQGTRFTCSLFTAFCLSQDRSFGPRVGFTLPRALGKATRRNRMKRRIREAVRLRLARIAPRWDIVINPRRAVYAAQWSFIEKEVERLVSRCGIS